MNWSLDPQEIDDLDSGRVKRFREDLAEIGYDGELDRVVEAVARKQLRKIVMELDSRGSLESKLADLLYETFR